MNFDTLSEREKAAFRAFIYLWHERDLSSITVNDEKDGICICKENGKWISFFYARGQRHNYHEFDYLYSVFEYHFNFLDKPNAEYCISQYPRVLSAALNKNPLVEPEYVKYDDFSDKEKTIFLAFIKVLRETGSMPLHIVYPTEDKVDKYIERLQFYKKGNKWVSYILERNEKTGYREYSDLYCLCVEAFQMLEKDCTDYCMDVFDPLIQDVIENEYGGFEI